MLRRVEAKPTPGGGGGGADSGSGGAEREGVAKVSEAKRRAWNAWSEAQFVERPEAAVL